MLAVWGVRQVYFLGSDSGGRLALYRGLPYDLPLGIKLYSEVYAAPVQVSSIPRDRRDSATNHTLRFHGDAVSLLEDLQARRGAARRAHRQQKTGTPAAAARRRAKARVAGSSGGGADDGSGDGGGRSGRRRAVSARNRELLALIPVAVLVTAGFTAVFIVESNQIGDLSLIYGGYFLAVCLGVHLFIRARLPYADPYLFPLCALLAAIGLVMLFRINDSLALKQASIFVAGAALLAVTIVFVRDYHALERYRYLIATVGILLLLAPRLPGIGSQVNGAYLGINLGPLSFQPAEVAKICIVIFLASYLHEKRELLTVAARRVAGLTIPPLKHFGPLLVVWGASMLMLVFIRDLGSSLMFFGAFLALLYVATARLSYVVAGLALFFVGAWVMEHAIAHVGDRVDIWLDPWHSKAVGRGPDPAVAVRPGRRRPVRAGPGRVAAEAAGAVRAPLRAAVPGLRQHPPGAAHGRDLRGDRQRARAVRRRGRGRRLRADRGARAEDRGDGARRVLEAARGRADGGVRPPGGGDHRRGRAADPADRRDPALRQLRRQLGDRQHDPARAAADDLQRRPAPARRAGEPERRPGGAAGVNPRSSASTGCSCCCSRRWSASRPTGRCSTPTTSRTTPQNRRPLIVEQTVKRGTIKTADGVTVAQSFPEGGGKHPVYVRRYPQGSLFGNPVGYSFVEVGQTGIERSENAVLAGERNEFTSILDQIRGCPAGGRQPHPDDRRAGAAGGDPGAPAGDRVDAGGERVRRGGGGARPVHRRGEGDGLGAGLRPELGQGPQGLQAAEQGELGRAARQPRHPEHLSARLDDEGGHRGRGPRLGRVHPGQRAQRRARRRRSAAFRCRTPAASSSATST